MTLEDQIRAVEDEIRRTPANKATQHHLGKLKAKLARLKDDLDRRRAGGRSGRTYAVKKSGHATVALVGLPSVGKSTLLNKLTNAQSAVAAYQFTTVTIIPGLMEHRGARIQVLDMPGLIRGAASGRGRGREVLSVARGSDLVLLMVDVFETNLEVLSEELRTGGVRLNEEPPNVTATKRERGGINVQSTVPLTHLDEDLVKDIVREWGFLSGDIIVREDITEDRLIDFLAGNRVYLPGVVTVNKIDLVTPHYVQQLVKRLAGWRIVPISAEKEIGLDILADAIHDTLGFIRIYLKPQGKDADMKEPLVVRRGATIEGVCNAIHRDMKRRFRYANVWGRSAKFPGQTVGLDHSLQDEDIVTLVARRA